MKKLLFVLISLLVIIPTIASAHTELASSNPASGQVVTEDLKEIVLTYEGKIESLSTMKLVKDGAEVPLISVVPRDKQLVGTLSTPLENGSYTIQWSIAGEDGHPITGEIPFSVQMAQKEEQKTETKEPDAVNKEEPKNEKTKQEQTKKQTNESSSYMKTTITVVIVLILVIGMFLLFRRKR
ncbi:copper resistance CopC family protein [Neobacillus drentensis]|uniref:copper resistance CopC family protein n=1 Tax=Neobacillus drentensis TaxID=220684 RepID=UPI002FFDE9E3